MSIERAIVITILTVLAIFLIVFAARQLGGFS